MFLVVVGHITLFSFHLDEKPSFLFHFCCSIEMPLFTFLSGLMCKNIMDWEGIKSKFIKQCRRLLFPFFVFGFLYAYMSGCGGAKFLTTNSKIGYWYLPFLLQCYFLTYLYNVLHRYILRKSDKVWHLLCWVFLLIVIFFAIDHIDVVMRLTTLPRSAEIENKVMLVRDILGVPNLFYYYVFFIAGFMTRKYGWFEKLFNNRRLYELSCCLYCVLFLASFKINAISRFNILSIWGIVCIVSIFYKMKDKSYPILKHFERWGKHSLSIYVLHYFFVVWCDLRVMTGYFKANQTDTLQIFFTLFLSISFCYACLFLCRLIKTSSVLSFICFGDKLR